MASSLIDILEPKEEFLIEAIKHFNVKPHLEVVLWFTVNEDISTPAIGFDERAMQFLGKLGAYVDVDTYKS